MYFKCIYYSDNDYFLMFNHFIFTHVRDGNVVIILYCPSSIQTES